MTQPVDPTGLGSSIDQLMQAVSTGNQAAFQEAIREFNLNYTNQVAQNYGYNTGVGTPGPAYAPTLPAQQDTGSIGYIPGFTSTASSDQSLQQGTDAANIANQAATQTGFYAPPSQSQFQPGTFVRADPSTYNTAQYGSTLLYQVSPTGQLTPVTPQQATAMGWNGNIAQTDVMPIQSIISLQNAPPSQVPSQTLNSLSTYANLNSAAQNQAASAAGLTGYYTAPQQVLPPGTNMGGGTFSALPTSVQQNYYTANGSNWNAAMQSWVNDSNAAIQQASQQYGAAPPAAGTPGGGPVQTQAAILQNANLSGMYNGAPTEQAREFNTTAAQNALNASNSTGQALLNLASTVQSDPFRQLQIMYGANNIPGINAAVNGLTSQYGLPSSFTAPPGSATNNLGGLAQSYQNAGTGNYGYAPGSTNNPGGNLGSATAAGATPQGDTTGMFTNSDGSTMTPQQLAASTGLTNTNQIVTRNFNTASPTAQNAATSALSMNTGQSQADITKQIQNNLPQFTSPQFGLASV